MFSPDVRRAVKVKDALEYLEKVKAAYRTEPWVYDNFLDIMRDFKAKTIDTPAVIERVGYACAAYAYRALFNFRPLQVEHLFAGNEELLEGFAVFLPPGYQASVVCKHSTARHACEIASGVPNS